MGSSTTWLGRASRHSDGKCNFLLPRKYWATWIKLPSCHKSPQPHLEKISMSGVVISTLLLIAHGDPIHNNTRHVLYYHIVTLEGIWTNECQNTNTDLYEFHLGFGPGFPPGCEDPIPQSSPHTSRYRALETVAAELLSGTSTVECTLFYFSIAPTNCETL